jgi:hypothetical protein
MQRMTLADSEKLPTVLQEANEDLLSAYVQFVRRLGWRESKIYASAEKAAVPPNYGKIKKDEFDPHIGLYQTKSGVYYIHLYYRKFKVMLDVDQSTGVILWYTKGPVNKVGPGWDMTEDESRVLDALAGFGGPVYEARLADNARMREFPYARGMEGITYRTVDKNRRGNAGDWRR